MRFLVLSFLLVAVVSITVAHPHHTHGGTGPHTHHASSSSESIESEEIVCSGDHEVVGCATKEQVCGGNTATRCAKKCICAMGYARKEAHCVAFDKCGEHNVVRREVTDCEDKNEVYLYCGSGCPARCGDKPGSRVCTTECVKGCFCKKGFVLNSRNKCVSPDKC